MALRVLKFGGTSVETPSHILAVARRILRFHEAGDRVVVVVSAMGQSTDELIRLAVRVSREPKRRELDMLLTAGERIAMALLAMALESLGCAAISFTGSQSGILTDDRHFDARIQTIRPGRIEQELERGRVVIVAGFQGVSPVSKEITTLGRGGSDTTAVALAVKLGAEVCQIFTDVPGVFSADPRVVSAARPIAEIAYEPMITFSHLGGRVLFRRAAILARRHGQRVEVLSTREDRPGTFIPSRSADTARMPFQEEDGPMEGDKILGVALESPVTWARVIAPPLARVELPAESALPFLTFRRTRLPDDSTFIEWTALPDAGGEAWLSPSSWPVGTTFAVDRAVALVSIVGEAVLADADLLRQVEGLLASAGTSLLASHTGSLSLSLLVPVADGDAVTRLLHRSLIERSAS